MTGQEHTSQFDDAVDNQVARLSEQHGHLSDSLTAIQAAIEARLRDDGLNYHLVKGRVKSSESVKGKLSKLGPEGSPKYPNGLDDLDDILGVRVITYIEPDVANVVSALTGQFRVLETTDKKAQQVNKGVLGYAAHHLILEVSEDNTPVGCAGCTGQRFEVQVKTVLQHAWAEFEHDIRYKAVGAIPPAIDRAFTLASGLIELADNEFVKIHEAVAREDVSLPGDAKSRAEPITSDALAEVLLAELPDHPRSKKEQYDWLVNLLNAMSITTVEEAVDLIGSADWNFVRERMAYKFPAGHVRIVDDLLLKEFGGRYIEETKALGDDPARASKLRFRLKKLGSSL
jgi:ppGpp synthetase/RelA/SpoT-type nucleotidyltranferase